MSASGPLTFNRASPSLCPQCGGEADYQFHYGRPKEDDPCCDLRGVDHMHRYCRVCKYEWREEPKPDWDATRAGR